MTDKEEDEQPTKPNKEPLPAKPEAAKTGEQTGEDGTVSESTELIDKANEAAARQERANEIHEKLIQKEEALQVNKTLGGSAEAGSQEKSKEEKDTEEAKKFLKGTGFEGMFDGETTNSVPK